MNLEHNNPHTVYNKHKELLQFEILKKIHHMMLTLPIGLLFLGQWHNNCKVTNSTAQIIQELYFCHDNCKNLVKMREVHQVAVGLCQEIVTLKWNDCALNYEYDIGKLTSWTVFLIFSLNDHKSWSWSKNMYLCWNWFVSSVFWDMIYITVYTVRGKYMWY